MKKTFSKSDLMNGHIIETRAGERGIIIKDNCYGEDAVVFAKHNWTGLDGFSEDMLWHTESLAKDYCRTVDIVKVFKPDLPTGFLSRRNKFSDGLTLVWAREEPSINDYAIEIDGVQYSESTLRSLIKKATRS